MESSNPAIALHDVTKVYSLGRNGGSVTAVKGISLSVGRGEFVVVTGRSGSGKTTLLNLVAGLTRPTSGAVLLEQVEMWRLPDSEQSRLRNQRIGFVFQFPSLMPSLTTLENVLLPTIAGYTNHKVAAKHVTTRERVQGAAPGGVWGVPKACVSPEHMLRDRAIGLLEEVGLADKLHSYPRQLSAGQQQRVVVARSLVNEPELLLADEPTSNLDEQTEREIMALIQQIHRLRHITILLVTHSTALVRYGTSSLRMNGGEIEAQPKAVGVVES